MEVFPGILVVFGPLVIMGLALAGEACIEKLSRLARRWQGLRGLHFG
jgi:hypothetical protein